ncbi:Transposase IS4 [Popillia japonica]|uniref:Transposase IS4 n=1 Tax=Popillia japonica TaxID=7064 RepID=A0AAW1KKI8_POPJA
MSLEATPKSVTQFQYTGTKMYSNSFNTVGPVFAFMLIFCEFSGESPSLWDQSKSLADILYVSVGLQLAVLYEVIIRCFNCCGYNHKAAVCKKETRCPKCAGSHKIGDCKATENNVKCVNCEEAVRKLNLRITINHAAWDSECSVFKRKLEIEKSKSLIANFELIQIAIEKYNPVIVMLSETHVTEEILDSEISIKGYNILRCNSYSRHTGGVIMYVKLGVRYLEKANVVFRNNTWILGIDVSYGFTKGFYLEKANVVFRNNTWILGIDVSYGFTKGFYGVLYHSPSTSDAEFLTFFDTWCDANLDSRGVFTVAGDFNIDMSKDTIYSKKLKNIIASNGMKQIVDTFTRIGYYKWQDNKTVSLISNFHGSEVTSVKRKQKEVACPAVARDYKEMMGGVDHADQLRAAYGLNRRSKKWSHKLFWGFIDMCFVNAYIIYCTYHEKIPLLEFRWSKALGLLTQKGRQPRGIKRSLDSTSGTSKRRKQNFSVCSDMQPHQQSGKQRVKVDDRTIRLIGEQYREAFTKVSGPGNTTT